MVGCARGGETAASHREEGGMGGPGWYESSWELQQGLQVHEGPLQDEPLPQQADDSGGAEPQPSPGACPVPPSAT